MPVVAGGPPCRVLPVPLHRAQPQPRQISRKICQQKEARVPQGQDSPQADDQRRLDAQLPRNAQSPYGARMMRQMTVAPERLWNALQNTQRGGERAVQSPRSKKRPVD